MLVAIVRLASAGQSWQISHADQLCRLKNAGVSRGRALRLVTKTSIDYSN